MTHHAIPRAAHRRTGRVAAVALAGVAAAVSPVLAPAAQAAVPSAPTTTASAVTATAVYRFVPIRLTVRDLEDGWPDTADEPRMYYGGATWADVVRIGGYPGTIPSTTFTGTAMSVDLWERDGGWTDHNHLGWAQVTTDLLGQEKLLRFKTSWYDYEIAYKVERVS